MLDTSSQTYGIQIVADMQPCDGAVAIAFQNGTAATLPADHPDREAILREAERSRSGGRPVGVIVDEAARLVELSPTHQTAVRSVRDEDSSRVMVAFWGYSPICYLTHDHPEFGRIRTTLVEATASGSQVLLANHRHMIQGETEIWWKILDVRPL
jgi:hypothetical protein